MQTNVFTFVSAQIPEQQWNTEMWSWQFTATRLSLHSTDHWTSRNNFKEQGEDLQYMLFTLLQLKDSWRISREYLKCKNS